MDVLTTPPPVQRKEKNDKKDNLKWAKSISLTVIGSGFVYKVSILKYEMSIDKKR